jgi:hypothetical protein
MAPYMRDARHHRGGKDVLSFRSSEENIISPYYLMGLDTMSI